MSENATETGQATENPSAGQEQTQTPPEGNAEPTTPDNKTTFDAEYVKGLRQESAKYRTERNTLQQERDALAAKVQEFEGQVPDLTSRLTSAEAKATRYEVAAEKGIPLNLAPRLVGTTREEIEADAESLLSTIGHVGTAPDLGQGNTGSSVEPAKDFNAVIRALAGR